MWAGCSAIFSKNNHGIGYELALSHHGLILLARSVMKRTVCRWILSGSRSRRKLLFNLEQMIASFPLHWQMEKRLSASETKAAACCPSSLCRCVRLVPVVLERDGPGRPLLGDAF